MNITLTDLINYFNNLKIDYDIKLHGKTYMITFKKKSAKDMKLIEEYIDMYKKDEQF